MFALLLPVLRIRDFSYRSGFADSYRWITDLDPAYYFNGFQDGNETKFFFYVVLLITGTS